MESTRQHVTAPTTHTSSSSSSKPDFQFIKDSLNGAFASQCPRGTYILLKLPLVAANNVNKGHLKVNYGYSATGESCVCMCVCARNVNIGET